MASAVRSDAGGSVIGFAIVFVSLVFRGFIPAPTWVWFVVLAVGVLLAVKDGISGLDVVTLGLAGFMIVGPLISGEYTATTDGPRSGGADPRAIGLRLRTRSALHEPRALVRISADAS